MDETKKDDEIVEIPKEEITVVTSRIVSNRNFVNDVSYECEMSDGSIWECDVDGKVWKQTRKGNGELTKLFNESKDKTVIVDLNSDVVTKDQTRGNKK